MTRHARLWENPFNLNGTELYGFELSGSTSLVPSGLAWSADGVTLHAVAEDSIGAYSLQTFDVAKPPQATLSLTGPSRATPGTAFTLSGRLSFVSGDSASGFPVSIVRTNPNGSKTTVAPKYATDGAFTVSGDLSTPGTYTYTAKYAGDATHAAATGTFTVSVHYQLVPSRTEHLLETAKVNGSGNLVLSYPHATRNVVFTATFSGDSQYSATSTSARVNAAARVSMTNGGWYTTTTTSNDGRTVRVYHATGYLDFAITVTPFEKGDELELGIQQLWGASWGTAETYETPLGDVSVTLGSLPLTNLTGDYLRFRAEVIPSNSDVTTVGNSTSWSYFEVVK